MNDSLLMPFHSLTHHLTHTNFLYIFLQAVTARGGRFLEAPVIGSKQPSSNGSLIILAAGDKTLYDDCYSCFEAMGKKTFYLGKAVLSPGHCHTDFVTHVFTFSLK